MRTVAAFIVLCLLASGGEPVPSEEVVGVYGYYSFDGEVFEQGESLGPSFFDIKPNGTLVFNIIHDTDGGNFSKGDRSRVAGSYTAHQGKDGCAEIVHWANNAPDRKRTSTICGDTFTWREEYEGETHEAVYRRRQ